MSGIQRCVRLMGATLVLCGLCGCSIYTARFSPPILQKSKVILRENDFRYLERDIRGNYSYWTLWIGYAPQASLQIPLGDPRLFSNALADLYSRSRDQAEGKTTQLINWTLDEDFFALPFVMRRKVTFRADLIEYTK